MADLYDELEFPQRAEDLNQYRNYQVDIAHWHALSEQFQRSFRQVYNRRSAAVLLVHGAQGAGKSLFLARLEADYKRTRDGEEAPAIERNLWHALVATTPPTPTAIGEATRNTTLLRADVRNDQWLAELKAFAKTDSSRVRIVLLDDAHKDAVLRPWTGLSATDFFRARTQSGAAILSNVAQQINDACRDELQRTLLVMCSNDRAWIDGLQSDLGKWYRELATTLDLPVPAPPTLERIVRINTNLLNRVSYWYCLDAADKDQRREVRKVLTEQRGFSESFHAVSGALSADSRRSGRPGNRNVLTLVTLGTEVGAVRAFIDQREIQVEERHPATSKHVAVWEAWGPWASKVKVGADRAFSWRARMLESEFMLRWVSLDFVATRALLANPVAGDLGARVFARILHRPSIGDRTTKKKTDERQECTSLDALLDVSADDPAVAELEKQFQVLGSRRSTIYEPAIATRIQSISGIGYGRGFKQHPALKPDLIVAKGRDEDGQYAPCALTNAVTDTDDAIAAAIRRTAHAVEFTAFLRENLAGLEDYLADKISSYAAMLEDV